MEELSNQQKNLPRAKRMDLLTAGAKKKQEKLLTAPVDFDKNPPMNAKETERLLPLGRKQAHMYCKHCLTCIPIL